MKIKKRCSWVSSDPLYIDYHDTEWGVPVFDDQLLFEYLNLEGAQAGLSWFTVLKKRENYRKLFNQFDPYKVAKYTTKKIDQLALDPGIIRHRLKIEAVVINAKAYLALLKEWDSFSQYIWHFVDGKPIARLKSAKPLTRNDVSDVMAKDLKKRGFKFVGSTICYAFMQAVGMVNDHAHDCFRCRQVRKKA
jgi:DNA-3-methyladenine glycosylase I